MFFVTLFLCFFNCVVVEVMCVKFKLSANMANQHMTLCVFVVKLELSTVHNLSLDFF